MRFLAAAILSISISGCTIIPRTGSIAEGVFPGSYDQGIVLEEAWAHE